MKIKMYRGNLVAAAIMMVFSMVAGVLVGGSDTANAITYWGEDNVTQISSSDKSGCGIASGAVSCWGDNTHGQLGNGTTDLSTQPVAVDTSGVLAGKTVTQVSTRGGSSTIASTCAVANGQAYCWGDNIHGQLGNGTTDSSTVPVAVDTSGVLAGKTVTQVSTGGTQGSTAASSCAIADGAVYCWGANSSSQLGDGTTDSSTVPVAVDTSGVLAGKTVTKISVQAETTCAVANGQAYCWGDNSSGQLGDGTTDSSTVPVAVDTSGVLAGKTVTQISLAETGACVVADGAAYCWGYGLLGNGMTDSTVPVAVDTSGVLAGKTVTQISFAQTNACLVADGAAYCWGQNNFGQLGGGTQGGSSYVPVAVDTSGALAGKTVTQVSLEDSTVCAVATNNAYCWGANTYGQLGNSSIPSSTTPLRVGTVLETSDKKIDSVGFSVDNGKNVMTINGSYMINYPDPSEWQSGLTGESFVNLNGTALDFCSDGTGYSSDELTAQGLSGVTDSQPCYYLFDSNFQPLISETTAKVYLPDNFDTTAQGTVSVNGSDTFTYNQSTTPNQPDTPTARVDNISLNGDPTIDNRPTFSGTAEPGSTVTVTVHSDPISCTAVADVNGNWSCTLPSDLEPGEHTVNIHIVLPGGGTQDLGPYAVTVPGSSTGASGATITNQTPLAPMTGEQRIVALTSPQVLFIAAGGIFALTVLLNILYTQVKSVRVRARKSSY